MLLPEGSCALPSSHVLLSSLLADLRSISLPVVPASCAMPTLPAEEEERKVVLTTSEREHIALLRRHAHAAGSLAQAVADAVSPLAMSQSLQARRPAAHRCIAGWCWEGQLVCV